MRESTLNQLIVVLGMHRSGTSAITKSLESLGVGLGADLHPAGFDNPTGFWEDKECLAINDALLAHLGSAYDRLAVAWSSIPENEITSELKLRAARLISQKLQDGGGIWGFKDPRTCRLLAFWSDVFQAIPCKVNFLIAVRNPASVAASMLSRNKIPAEKAYLLWLQHVVPTILETRGSTRVVVDYDDFLMRPRHNLGRIGSAFGLALREDAARTFEEEFLEGALRHSVHTLPMLSLDARASPAVVHAYGLLSKLATDELSLDDVEVGAQFANFAQHLRLAESSFSYANSLEAERIALWHAVGARDQQIADAQASIAAACERERLAHEKIELLQVHVQTVATLNEVVLGRGTELATMRKDWDALTAESSALSQSLHAAQENEARLVQLLSDVERDAAASIALSTKRIEALQAEHHDMAAAQELAASELASFARQVDALAGALAERDRIETDNLARLHEEIIRLEQVIGVATAQPGNGARDLTSAVLALRGAVVQGENCVRELNDKVFWLIRGAEDARRELAQVLASKSWRSTRILRWMRRRAISIPHARVRPALARALQDAWHRLPLPYARKKAVKDFAFGRFPSFFANSQAYQAWKNFNSPMTAPVARHASQASAIAPLLALEYVPIVQGRPIDIKPVKLICFYLPQFHPIAENSAWWGEGFTEWTNVRPAQPQFEGHYQPHVPDELGYYDLSTTDVQHRQVELAKLYGIEGFCFYFYWFGGKRLLEQPIQNYLNDATLDLPFCLCWANENWSRRWDGLDSDVLIAQNYSEADDIAFISHVAQYMRDARYIRVNGKPLLLIYRPSLLPSAESSAERWRNWCRRNGLGEIFLAYTQSFESVDPKKYGFDAAIEFPPNNSAPPNVTGSVTAIVENFGTTVYDWNVFLERSKEYKRVGYKLFRSVCPSWDNTARKKNRGTVFLDSSPQKYQQWLVNAIRETQEVSTSADENLVFVNAWNEWAEGAHLEPDARYGYAWLQATRDALLACGGATVGARRMIVVTHDAHPHGAQYLALHLAKTLSSDFGFQVDLVVLGDGMLRDQYAKWATVHDLAGIDPQSQKAVRLAEELFAKGHATALVNTTVSGLFLGTLKSAGIRCVALVHELAGVISDNKLEAHAAAIARDADVIVFPAEEVAQQFCGPAEYGAAKRVIRPQGLYKKNRFKLHKQQARADLRSLLRVPLDAELVLNVGYADHRKGIDRFVSIGQHVLAERPRAYFVWVGHWDGSSRHAVDEQLSSDPNANRFLFVGRQEDTDLYYAGADLFALTSREDPFPSVVLESLDVSVPIVGFEGSGGFAELLGQGGGVLVAANDESSFAKTVCELLDSPSETQALGESGAEILTERFSFRHYIYDLLDYAGQPLKRISAVVPNFNYANYLAQRLSSIVEQSYPIYELLVLDDASTDNSLDVIRNFMETCEVDVRLIVNERNSGSVFSQWRKGAELARGDYLWICEADDGASTGLVESLCDLFIDDKVALAYAQSFQVDECGGVIAEDYLAYTHEVSESKWQSDYVSGGVDELAAAFSIKNTIPNVSAVLFSRSEFLNAMQLSSPALERLKFAGDWLLYVNILRSGNIGFSARSLNVHRRHNRSVTASPTMRARHLAEIIFMQKYVDEISPVPDRLRLAADAYVRKIYSQFSLDPVHERSPVKNTQVLEALQFLNKGQ